MVRVRIRVRVRPNPFFLSEVWYKCSDIKMTGHFQVLRVRAKARVGFRVRVRYSF
jgi:hypothetical protein